MWAHESHKHRTWIKTTANHIMILKESKSKQKPNPLCLSNYLAVGSETRGLFGSNSWSPVPWWFQTWSTKWMFICENLECCCLKQTSQKKQPPTNPTLLKSRKNLLNCSSNFNMTYSYKSIILRLYKTCIHTTYLNAKNVYLSFCTYRSNFCLKWFSLYLSQVRKHLW